MALRQPNGTFAKGVSASPATQFQKGQSYNRGKTLSDAHRAALSKSQLLHAAQRSGPKHYKWRGGLPLCGDCKKKLSRYDATHCRACWSKYNSGENAHRWRGGVSTENHLERTKFGLTIRKQVFERDGYKCVSCSKGGTLHVDHIKSWADYPELRFEISNCQTLCVPCHYERTFGRKIPKTSSWGLKGLARATS